MDDSLLSSAIDISTGHYGYVLICELYISKWSFIL